MARQTNGHTSKFYVNNSSPTLSHSQGVDPISAQRSLHLTLVGNCRQEQQIILGKMTSSSPICYVSQTQFREAYRQRFRRKPFSSLHFRQSTAVQGENNLLKKSTLIVLFRDQIVQQFWIVVVAGLEELFQEVVGGAVRTWKRICETSYVCGAFSQHLRRCVDEFQDFGLLKQL